MALKTTHKKSDAGRLLRLPSVVIPLMVCAGAMVPSLSSAAFYRCNMENGEVAYQETPCEKNEKEAVLNISLPPPEQQSSTMSAGSQMKPGSSQGSQSDVKEVFTNTQKSDVVEQKSACQSMLDAIAEEEKNVIAACEARHETYCGEKPEFIALKHESLNYRLATKQQIRNYERNRVDPKIIQLKNRARNIGCL